MRRPAALVIALTVMLGAAVASAAVAPAASDPLTAVKVSTDTATKPTVKFAKPFEVAKSTDSTVAAGTGDALATGQTAMVDYVIVNGRTGKEVQTSYGDVPAAIALDGTKTAKSLVKGLTGKNVGSRVLLAVAPKDGLAKRLKGQHVKKDDTLLFVIDVKSAHTPLARATGDAVAPVEGLPTVALAADGSPTITIPSGVAAPTSLVVQPLIKGTGPVVTAGQTISVHYVGVIWDTSKKFDSSWDRKTPADFVIGKGQVIAGWDEGLVGQTVGSQVLLIVPPAKGYGAQGSSGAGIKGTDTLVFVVDILDAI